MNKHINQSNIKFKNASEDNWRTIQSIAHITWPETYGLLLPPSQLQFMLDLIYSEPSLRKQMEQSHQFFIGYQLNNPCGFASVQKHHKTRNNLMIHKLYVLPEFHGKGIGKAFIQWIEAFACDSGHQVVELKVFHKNKAAIKFYEHMGFSVYSEVQSEISSKYIIIDLVMRKLLLSRK